MKFPAILFLLVLFFLSIPNYGYSDPNHPFIGIPKAYLLREKTFNFSILASEIGLGYGITNNLDFYLTASPKELTPAIKYQFLNEGKDFFTLSSELNLSNEESFDIIASKYIAMIGVHAGLGFFRKNDNKGFLLNNFIYHYLLGFDFPINQQAFGELSFTRKEGKRVKTDFYLDWYPRPEYGISVSFQKTLKLSLSLLF
ncbi:MAG: hypothetical protein U9O41_03485 [Candidatus Aerophobetes bacterium]|nr:hypothetical protein [Candidatus Aerophobetes bacterium]